MRLMITADLRNRGDASTRGNAVNLVDSIIDRKRRCRRRIDEAANLHAERKRKRSFRYRTSGLLSSIVGADRFFFLCAPRAAISVETLLSACTKP